MLHEMWKQKSVWDTFSQSVLSIPLLLQLQSSAQKAWLLEPACLFYKFNMRLTVMMLTGADRHTEEKQKKKKKFNVKKNIFNEQ